jgi:hypothetical protein
MNLITNKNDKKLKKIRYFIMYSLLEKCIRKKVLYYVKYISFLYRKFVYTIIKLHTNSFKKLLLFRLFKKLLLFKLFKK